MHYLKKVSSPQSHTQKQHDISRHDSDRMPSLRTDREMSPNLISAFTERYGLSRTVNNMPLEKSYDIFKIRKSSEANIGGPSFQELVTPIKSFNKNSDVKIGKLGVTQIDFGRKLSVNIKPKQSNYLNANTSQLGNKNNTPKTQGNTDRNPMLAALHNITGLNEGLGDFGKQGDKKRTLHQAIDRFISKNEKRKFSITDRRFSTSHESPSHNTSIYATSKLPMPQNIEEVELRMIMGSDENQKNMIDLSVLNQLKRMETSILDRSSKATVNLADRSARKDLLLSQITKLSKKQAHERRDAQSLTTWFNSLARDSITSTIDDLTAYINSQTSLCCFAMNELHAYLNTACKDYAAYLQTVRLHSIQVTNKLLAYITDILRDVDQRRANDSKLLNDRFDAKEQLLTQTIEKLETENLVQEQKIIEQQRLIASMRSKLYSDYLVIKNLKNDAQFSESKLDVVQDENYKISRIISDLGEAAVRYVDCRVRR